MGVRERRRIRLSLTFFFFALFWLLNPGLGGVRPGWASSFRSKAASQR